jgi:hypothetical protein
MKRGKEGSNVGGDTIREREIEGKQKGERMGIMNGK